MLYEKASPAQLNWAKSEARLMGGWRGKAVPSLPGGLEWRKWWDDFGYKQL